MSHHFLETSLVAKRGNVFVSIVINTARSRSQSFPLSTLVLNGRRYHSQSRQLQHYKRKYRV